MMNVTIYDNGAGFAVMVNGLIVAHFNTLGGAWEHIKWMYQVASQQFTVGKNELLVTEWLDHMYAVGFLDK